MSSVHRDVEPVSAGSGPDNSPHSDSSQELEKPVAADAIFDTPSPNAQGLDLHTAVNGEFENPTTQYPTGLALFFLIIALCIANFIVSLDRTIITTVSRRCNFPLHHYD